MLFRNFKKCFGAYVTFPEYVWAITTAWCKTVPKVVPKFNMAAVKPEVVLAE